MRAQHYIQACYVVPDIEAAIREYVRVTGIGPWIVMPHVTPENGLYRGRPMHLEMSCAFAQSGSSSFPSKRIPPSERTAWDTGTDSLRGASFVWADRPGGSMRIANAARRGRRTDGPP